MFDCIVIGAGPSGMMAAVTASSYGKNVLLIDKNPKLGRKMRLSGGGRCNITNHKSIDEFIQHLPNKNGRFLYHALHQFGPTQIMNFFCERGVGLKIEDHDRVFPKSDRSTDFIHVLEQELIKNDVKQALETTVQDITIKNDLKSVHTDRGVFQCKHLVIATGGQSYPHTGSTGFAHEWAQKNGVQVTPLYPTETPILSSEGFIRDKTLQGLSFSDVVIQLKNTKGKTIKSQRHDLIFTHFGISGPAALMLSQFVYHHLQKERPAKLSIDFHPDQTEEDLKQRIMHLKEIEPLKSVQHVLGEFGPKRLVTFLLDQLNIPQDLQMAHFSKRDMNAFIDQLKEFSMESDGVKPIPYAFVTGGGISIKEIDPKTMACKKINGVYFVGEALDLHGYTGGYNITIALSTGYVAGTAIGTDI